MQNFIIYWFIILLHFWAHYTCRSNNDAIYSLETSCITSNFEEVCISVTVNHMLQFNILTYCDTDSIRGHRANSIAHYTSIISLITFCDTWDGVSGWGSSWDVSAILSPLVAEAITCDSDSETSRLSKYNWLWLWLDSDRGSCIEGGRDEKTKFTTQPYDHYNIRYNYVMLNGMVLKYIISLKGETV